ncbi:Citrate synthase 2 [Pigmentiphaga humi]|uniref:citrate synthase (unknown stereospecificity) n=2 Tax=Pigmentiphaga humi TaxID=2478468 RepID=A0A3P4AXV0_9BURK|nr:Citrate synthase 2 [Pigmentiphaga humi]
MIRSKVCTLDGDDIYIRGHDLLDLTEERDYVDVFCLQAFGEFPSPPMKRMVNALLVSVADHGLTPSVMAARFTLYGSPEAMQGAVAAGLLGGGDRLLGTISTAAEMLQAAARGLEEWTDDDIAHAAAKLVTQYRESKKRIPGIGHMIHVNGDPRSTRMFNIAKSCGYYGNYCKLAIAVAEEASRQTGRFMPLNAPGAKAGIILDMGLPPSAGRAFNLLGRTGGLLAHVLEEQQEPIAADAWKMLRDAAAQADGA